MSNYIRGEMILNLRVEDTFSLQIIQDGQVRRMISQVSAINSNLVTRIELERIHPFTLNWENHLSITGKSSLEERCDLLQSHFILYFQDHRERIKRRIDHKAIYSH